MTITLYKPSEEPQQLAHFEGAENLISGGNRPMEHVAALMGCTPGLVDVLASGPNYVMFSIFDYEGPINLPAMEVLTKLTGVEMNVDDEDEQLCGPILVVTLD